MKYSLSLFAMLLVNIASPVRSQAEPEEEAASAESQSIGTVIVAQGLLNAMDGAENVRELKAGAPVFLNEQIIADEGTKAQIQLTDETLIAVGENSAFRVSNYVFNQSPEDAISLEIVLGTVRMLPGGAEREGEGGIKVLTADVEVTAEGTMFTTTSSERGTSVGFYHGSGRVSNAGGTLRLGKRGSFDFTFVPKDRTQAPRGQISQPDDLTGLESSFTGIKDPSVSAVSTELKNRFPLQKMSPTDWHNLRKRMQLGGFFGDRGLIKRRDRQVDLHLDGIGCSRHCKP